MALEIRPSSLTKDSEPVVFEIGIGSVFFLSGAFLFLAALVVVPLRLCPATKVQRQFSS